MEMLAVDVDAGGDDEYLVHKKKVICLEEWEQVVAQRDRTLCLNYIEY
jgi:hypothetical protein